MQYKWEVTIVELTNSITRYKVTRRYPELSIAETLVFNDKQDAILAVQRWLDSS